MKILNKSGIQKVVEYIGEDRCMYVNPDGKHMLLGDICEDDKAKLKGVGVILNEVSKFVYEAALDDPELVDGEQEENESNVNDISSDEVRKLADAIVPYLQRRFPTKEEMNEVLTALQQQMIDPDEMIDGLKMQIKRIKKQSRENDEIG